MKTILDRLINQLDSLIPFIALSYEDIFNVLNDHRPVWFNKDPNSLPHIYATYRKQINHSAFLLGYSYFETFLTDLIAKILLERPSMLSKKKKLDYEDILHSKSLEGVIDTMIKKELLELLYKSMSDIVEELRGRYNLTINDEKKEEFCKAALLRNCIIHNSSRADRKLAQCLGIQEGEEFELSAGHVHGFGVVLRAFARKAYQEAQQKHKIDENNQKDPEN